MTFHHQAKLLVSNLRSVLGVRKEKGNGDYYRGHVSHLREKLGLIGVDEEVIRSVSNVGYMFIDTERMMEEIELPTAEVEAQIRVYHHSQFSYWPERSTVKPIGGEETRLTPLENRLMEKFAINRNVVLSLSQLWDAAWPDDLDQGLITSIKTHISHLRDKIEPGVKRRDFQTIVTRWGWGYMLVDHRISSD